MRHVVKSLLIAAIAVTLTALVVPAAFATDAVEVVDDGSGHCPPLVEGGCHVHLVGTVEVQVDFFGIWVEEDTCDIELDMKLDSTGSGEIYDIDSYATEVDTSTQECEVETFMGMCSPPWEIGQPAEETSASTVHLVADLCFDLDEADICSSAVEVDLVETPSESYGIALNGVQVGTHCRWVGSLSAEANDVGNADIHVNHL